MNDMSFACRYGRTEPRPCVKCGDLIYEEDDYKKTDYGEYICLKCYEYMYWNDEEEEDE